MAEETDTETITTETTSTEVNSIPYADAEGNLRKDWYVDEDLKDGEETLKRFNNVKHLAKSYNQVRKMVGTDMATKPNDNFTESDWDAWHEAGGRPATAADYNFTKPDELPDEHYSEAVALEAMELFHKLGLNNKQAKTIFDFHNGLVIKNLAAEDHDIKLERQNVKDGLHNDWGAAYESKHHLGNLAIEEGCKDATATPEGDAEFKARLCDKFGDDPDFIRYSSNLGNKFAEHGSMVISQVPTPGDLQTQIAEIMAKPEYTHRDKKIRQPLIDQALALRKQLNKSKGIT